ncbi:hypothetical protein Q8A67_021477 [Cirrhinus molitorella]|uniref:Uncharacterized protein n=1 Tax=Cirrhinus molitorella TaxID=172907 RepID=A0AA88P9V9_9TELE|nr:hypothetical protein Q8A67_021477 [Cirrhinus molitorella]
MHTNNSRLHSFIFTTSVNKEERIPLRTPRCAASGCRLNRFYSGSCMLIQCGNCWHNWRKRSSHVVIVLRAVLCLSDSQCRLSDCLGHCHNSLASERRCETE